MRALVAAIDHVVEQPAVAVGGVAWAQDFDVGGGLDQALRIARRAVEIDDDGVVRVVRRQRHGGAGDDPVVGADRAEHAALEGGLDPDDLELDDLGGRVADQIRKARRSAESCQPVPHRVPPFMSLPGLVAAGFPTLGKNQRSCQPKAALAATPIRLY